MNGKNDKGEIKEGNIKQRNTNKGLYYFSFFFDIEMKLKYKDIEKVDKIKLVEISTCVRVRKG